MAVLPDNKLKKWKHGTLNRAYSYLGAHPTRGGVEFNVWAPHARAVHITGDFNDWQPAKKPMQSISESGIWRTRIKEAAPGQCYKYAVTGPGGSTVLKADPFAFYAEEQPPHASIIYNFPDYDWSDDDWMTRRTEVQQPDQPLSVYEVHLGSWQRDENGNVLSYRQLSDRLIPYVKEMGFTHIELMPLMAHPYTPSWGYQTTGYFAPTSRYGRPEDLMAFIDACHQQEIGVILDWVPGHFPKDEHGLAYFDGTALFEHADPRRREHADWGTHNFNFEQPEVRSFLLSNAAFWCDKYHADGFRVDAVASMLYLDYSKSEGEWLPNASGGNQNLGAIKFLQQFNRMLQENYPGVLRIAEESTSWPNVTRPVDEDGLGFDYKWNMGWMNDTIHYISLSPENRLQESHSITFPRTFAFSEQFILPFSHDEVVHLKKSLWSKMPGPSHQKFAQLRLLYLYMMGFPGKKLLFMGSEIASQKEWSESRSLEWELLEQPEHKDLRKYLRSLLHWYQTEPLLFTTDHYENGFDWTDLSRKEEAIFSFRRQSKNSDKTLIFIFNFSDQPVRNYRNEAMTRQNQSVIFNSLPDRDEFESLREFTGTLFLKPFQGVVLGPNKIELNR